MHYLNYFEIVVILLVLLIQQIILPFICNFSIYGVEAGQHGLQFCQFYLNENNIMIMQQGLCFYTVLHNVELEQIITEWIQIFPTFELLFKIWLRSDRVT